MPPSAVVPPSAATAPRCTSHEARRSVWQALPQQRLVRVRAAAAPGRHGTRAERRAHSARRLLGRRLFGALPGCSAGDHAAEALLCTARQLRGSAPLCSPEGRRASGRGRRARAKGVGWGSGRGVARCAAAKGRRVRPCRSACAPCARGQGRRREGPGTPRCRAGCTCTWRCGCRMPTARPPRHRRRPTTGATARPAGRKVRPCRLWHGLAPAP